MANTSKTKDKVENPEAHFAKPKQVVKDNVLSRDDKKNALNTWEQDERQLLTASNEGMSGSDEGLRVDDDNRLREVVRAKGTIGEKPKHKPSHYDGYERPKNYIRIESFLPPTARSVGCQNRTSRP